MARLRDQFARDAAQNGGPQSSAAAGADDEELRTLLIRDRLDRLDRNPGDQANVGGPLAQASPNLTDQTRGRVSLASGDVYDNQVGPQRVGQPNTGVQDRPGRV
jgi:hypothetical protein